MAHPTRIRSDEVLLRLAKHKGRAYVCTQCTEKPFADTKGKFETHHMKFHARPTDLPFWCSLCNFRCTEDKQLTEHIFVYGPHRQEARKRKVLDSSPYLHESKQPYKIMPTDFKVLSHEEYVALFYNRLKKVPTPVQSPFRPVAGPDLLSQALEASMPMSDLEAEVQFDSTLGQVATTPFQSSISTVPEPTHTAVSTGMGVEQLPEQVVMGLVQNDPLLNGWLVKYLPSNQPPKTTAPVTPVLRSPTISWACPSGAVSGITCMPGTITQVLPGSGPISEPLKTPIPFGPASKTAVTVEDIMPQLLETNEEVFEPDYEDTTGLKLAQEAETPKEVPATLPEQTPALIETISKGFADLSELLKQNNKSILNEIEKNTRSVRCMEKVMVEQTKSINHFADSIKYLNQTLITHDREERRREDERKRKAEDQPSKEEKKTKHDNRENDGSPRVKSVLAKVIQNRANKK